jgi:ferric-dicitrate binding protein FerR (iron transport regulator)
MAFALLAAAAIVGGVLWWEQPVDTSTYVTGRGEQTSVTLADSSDVTLNHTSALVVSPRGDDRARRVTLAGEAFFHVRRNGTPFIVSTDVGSVEVLGTEFNVRVRDDRLEVGVVSGSVRVTVRHEGRDTSTLLKAGTLLSWARGERPGVPDPLLFAEYPGWLHRKLLFQRASVPSIAREIEMRFDVTVSVQNPRLLRETISGALDATSADGALQTLAHLTGARVRHDARGYHLE